MLGPNLIAGIDTQDHKIDIIGEILNPPRMYNPVSKPELGRH